MPLAHHRPHRAKRPRWLALAAALPLAQAVAGAPEPAPESAYIDDLPVVLSVSRLVQPLADTPAAVTVLDREQIRASGARELAELLRLVPGFQVAARNQQPARAVYHGLGEEYPSRVQVLIDGRPQYSPLFAAGVNWNLLPVTLADIDRIEIVRGSNSAAQGFNAFLGVIHIVTRHSSESHGLALETRQGGGGIADTRVRLGGRLSGGSWRVSYQEQNDDGLRPLFDSRHARLLDVRGDLDLSHQDTVQIGFGGIVSETGSGSGSATNPWRTPREAHQYAQFGWRRSLSAGEDLQMRVSWQAEQMRENAFRVAQGPASAEIDFRGDAERIDAEVQHTRALGLASRLVWGFGAGNERLRMPQFLGRDDWRSRQSARLFANLEHRFAPDWLLNLGGSWTHDNLTGSALAPRLALNHHLAPGHTVRAGVSRALRAISLLEQYGQADYYLNAPRRLLYDRQYLASGILAPERVDSRELGYVATLPAWNLQGDLRVFEERLPNHTFRTERNLQPPWCEPLAAPACGEADHVVNAQRARIRGAEYQLRWRPAEGTQLIVNQSFVRIDARLGAFETNDSPATLQKIVDQTERSAPRHTSSLILHQALPGGVQFMLAYSRLSSMRWTLNSELPGYHRIDWRIAWPFRTGATQGEIAWVMQSDVPAHGEYRPNELVERRGFLTLRLSL